MPRFAQWCAPALALLLLAGCATEPSQQQVTLKIAAADNFAPVLRQLAQEYHAQQPWVDFEFHFANTAKLEQDIEAGTAFDLYVPARAESVLALADPKHDAIIPSSRVPLALNQLVVVAAPDTTLGLNLDSLLRPEIRQIAVADPNGQLLGYLTRQALINMQLLPPPASAKPLVASPGDNAGLANNLESKLLVVPDDDAVIAAVKDGRAQLGVTYNSYAVADKKVRVLSPLPPQVYENVFYLTAIPRNAPHYDEAYQFLNFLRSIQARDIMQRSGLLVN
jgi:molybdate transport system substrate-binding protein